jgi:hypothetical protein
VSPGEEGTDDFLIKLHWGHHTINSRSTRDLCCLSGTLSARRVPDGWPLAGLPKSLPRDRPPTQPRGLYCEQIIYKSPTPSEIVL